MKKALVTVLLGDMHKRVWNDFLKTNWEAWAEQYGYEILVFDERHAFETESIYLTKYEAMASQRARAFDFVCWLDADIFINLLDAPDIQEHCAPDRLAICLEGHIPDSPLFRKARNKVAGIVARNGIEYGNYNALHRAIDPASTATHMFNTGVFCFYPEQLADWVAAFPRLFGDYAGGAFFDQVPFTHYCEADGKGQLLDERFNALWLVFRFLQNQQSDSVCKKYPFVSGHLPNLINAVNNSWFLHFAGRQDDIKYLPALTRTGNRYGFHKRFFKALEQEVKKLTE
ncbi:hypothetical protein NUH88_07795 [Nisaea acidiphila]|uniref:Uncharacterized protein n=1 Tax=Nisaea acidiphila TaxID=1862145 RepID=A0A9J7AWU3_9PROT|nr:hypothetical protein [Nisaea acidiphila]UUX51590.1 hypothetical protein NUH88_07795 [Nisaea acidiphila]